MTHGPAMGSTVATTSFPRTASTVGTTSGTSGVALRLAGVMLLAIAVRVWGLESQSFSMDEVAELRIAMAEPGAILFRGDGFPPLFSLLLHGALRLFGTDEAARWLTVTFGCASLLPVWALARRIGGEPMAWVAALLLAVSPFHVWHSQNGRGYVLYFLLAALALWLFYRALASSRAGDWLAYAISGTLGMYCHYYFATLLLLNGLVFLLESPSRRLILRAALAHGVLLLCVLPLAWLAPPDFSSEAATPFAVPFRLAAIPYSYFVFMTGYSIGPSVAELHNAETLQALRRGLGWLLALSFSVGVLGYQGGKALGPVWRRRLLPLVILPVLVTVPLAGALSITYQVRHLIWVFIPIVILLAAGICQPGRRWWRTTALLVLLLLFATALYNRRYLARYANEDVRALAAYLRSNSGVSVPVVIMTGYMYKPLSWYLPADAELIPVPAAGRENASLRRSLDYVRERIPEGTAFWLVYSRAFHGDPRGRFREAVVAEYGLERRASFPGVELYRTSQAGAGSR